MKDRWQFKRRVSKQERLVFGTAVESLCASACPMRWKGVALHAHMCHVWDALVVWMQLRATEHTLRATLAGGVAGLTVRAQYRTVTRLSLVEADGARLPMIAVSAPRISCPSDGPSTPRWCSWRSSCCRPMQTGSEMNAGRLDKQHRSACSKTSHFLPRKHNQSTHPSPPCDCALFRVHHARRICHTHP